MKALLRTTAASRLAVSASMQRALVVGAPARFLSTLRPPAPPAFRTLSSTTSNVAIQQPLAVARRDYSTAPNQHQVLQSFGTPFAQFVYTISRIARIITFTTLGIGTIGIVSFEAAHQYVEHVAMPASSPSSSSAASDEFGWRELALEESWSGSLSHPGTDPRLGVKGRHAVRSAWMCVNWGGGISPSVLFGGGAAGNSGLGRTAITSMSAAKTLKVDDGMILAMQYLNLAVKIAQQKGITLPDTGAIRAGLVSKQAAEQQLSNVDPLAVALEARLAAVKERQGSRGALESAIGSYEKLYDVSTLTDREGGKGGEKLVRLATKLADLHSALGQTKEAEAWLNRAVGIAAGAGAHTPEPQHSSPVVEVRGAEEEKKSGVRGWFSKSTPTHPTPAATPAVEQTPAVKAAVALPPGGGKEPSPALTRSLITALVSKSAFHATSSSLNQALQTQMSALQLTDAKLSRLSLPSPATSTTPAQELHKLWLLHHQSILNLHVAETIYAITRSNTKQSKLPAWLSTSTSKRGMNETSLGWLEEATFRAELVVKELEGGKRGGKGEGEGAVELAEGWKKDKEVALVAARVLRDAKRVLQTAGRSRSTLEAAQ